jgi:iron complex transport system substrate-binding protein
MRALASVAASVAVAVAVAACGRTDPTPPAPQAGSQAGTQAGSAGPHPTTAPARIVSLSPSATEIVAALALTPELVGVDSYSKFPASVAALPKVGDYLHPNLETILALRPTVVIADDVHVDLVKALRAVDVPAIVCAIHALPDVELCLHDVGAALDRGGRAREVSARIEAALDRARSQRPATHPKVLAIIDRDADGLGDLVAAGPGSYVDELLAVVGGDNVLAASAAAYPKISLEEVLRGAPDVILDLSFAGHTSTAAWDTVDVPAVRAHRVVAIGDDVLLAPSPRVDQALAALATALAPPRPDRR